MRIPGFAALRDARAGFRLRFGVAVLLATAAQAAPRRALVLEAGEHLQSLQVVSVIRNSALGVQSPQGDLLTEFVAGGLLEAGMAGIHHALAQSTQQSSVPGAIDSAAAFDFRMVFSGGLDSVVAASPWPDARTLRILDLPPAIDARNELAAESLSDATLLLETRWFLSADLKTAVITTAATLYDQSGKTPRDSVRYRADFVYASEPAPGHTPQDLLQGWAADGGVRLRRVTREGVHETLLLLADDVFARQCGPLASTSADEEFEARDPRDGGGNGWRGVTVTQSDARIHVRCKDGNLFSVPAEYRKPVFVFRQEDFRFKISYRPDDRPCIQVDHPSGSARVWVDPAVELSDNDGLSDPRVELVLRTVQKRAAELRTAWETVHGARLRAGGAPDPSR